MGRRPIKDKEYKLSPGMEKMAVKMSSWIILLQTKWAIMMNMLIGSLPTKLKWPVMICFFACMFSFSGLLIIEGLQGKGLKVSINVDAAQQPKIPFNGLPRTAVQQEKLPVRIRKIRSTLDSLNRTGDGRKMLDSLIRHRPGLMDSLKKIESIYK